MRSPSKIRLRFRSFFFRNRVDRELEDEFRFHLDQLVEEHTAAGLPPIEARRLALCEMGGINQFEEECRDMRRVSLIDDLSRDLHYALRSFRRSPGFALLAVLVMAFGIGANTAVFSVVNAVLLKPLSFREPGRIASLSVISTTREQAASMPKQASMLDVQDWHDQNASFEAMAFYNSAETAIMRGATAEYARVATVSSEFFLVLGIEPIAGRLFGPDETKQGAPGALILSYAYWQSRYGGDPQVLGKTISVAVPRPIVGVMPPGFDYPSKADLWVTANGPTQPRGAQNYSVLARLKPAVTLEHAQAEMTAIAERLEQQYPKSNRGRGVAVARIEDAIVGNIRGTLYLLLGGVGVVLLIACANTATLLLGKASARTREVAVRAALGASRRRIVRQLITESSLLAFIAGISGLLLAYGGSKLLIFLAPSDLPRLAEIGVDRWVLAFTLATSIVTSLLFGLVPAFYASKVDLIEALKQGGGRVVSGGNMARVRGGLVVIEIALGVVLLSAAGLLIKSYAALNHVALGFQPEKVVVMRATMPGPRAAAILRGREFFRDLLAEAATIPGVLAAGVTMTPPGQAGATGAYLIDRLPPNPDFTQAPSAVLSIVGPGTFAALGIPLKSGRDFDRSDLADRPLVAVVNDALVRKSFPNGNPLGRTIYCTFDTLQGMTIVGVVGDVRQRGPDREPMPECYMMYAQHTFNGATLSVVARTAGDPAAIEPSLQRLSREKSPDVPMKFTTMETLLAQNVATPRFRSLLFGVFAGLAVCLAMAGVYGVMAYAVGQRSNEIGLRMALGASQGSILRLILSEGLILAAAGLILGLAGAAAITRLLTTMLFQVQPNDPLVYLSVAGLLPVVTLCAGFVPARRAAGIDPLSALRQE